MSKKYDLFLFPFTDFGNGISPSDGATLFFFGTGTSTSTPKNTFTSQSATIPNTNPIVSDSNGVFRDIFIVGSYKVVLKDKNCVQKLCVKVGSHQNLGSTRKCNFLWKKPASIILAIFPPKKIAHELYAVGRSRKIPDSVIFESGL